MITRQLISSNRERDISIYADSNVVVRCNFILKLTINQFHNDHERLFLDGNSVCDDNVLVLDVSHQTCLSHHFLDFALAQLAASFRLNEKSMI